MAYSQQDPQWAGIKLGTSNYTIGNGGCYITAFFNVLAQFGITITPKQMNEKLLREGRYVGDGGDVDGKFLSQMYPEIQYVRGYDWSNTPNLDMDALAIQNKPGYEAIVGLDYQLNIAGIQTHFCRLRGVDANGKVIIDDSLGGQRVVVEERYGNQGLSVCYMDLYYKKPATVPVPVVPTPAPIDPTIALNNRIKELELALVNTKLALKNEQEKPPKEVIKEVEKIVEKVVTIEVEKPYTPEGVWAWIVAQVNKFIKRGK